MADKRIHKPQHIRQVLSEQINVLRSDSELDKVTKARTIAYLSSVALTAMRDGEMEERLTEIETMMKG